MKIEKAIVFFDLETTGVNTQKDRIVQMAYIKIKPDGEREEKSILVNPEMPIPVEASNVHGITNDMVKDANTFKSISKSLFSFLDGCDLGGFNSDQFDIPLLIEEFKRAGIDFPTWELNLLDVRKNEWRKSPNKLFDIYKRYTGQVLEDAHDALADIRATIKVLECQQKDEPDMSIYEIDEACQGDRKRFDLAGKMYSKDGSVFWSFGKNIDKPVLSDLSYVEWVLRSDFPNQTKDLLRGLIK